MSMKRERAEPARSLRMRGINQRLGEVVCICEKDGEMILYDPAALRRKDYIRVQKIRQEKAKRDPRETEP